MGLKTRALSINRLNLGSSHVKLAILLRNVGSNIKVQIWLKNPLWKLKTN